jgi:hypothetical protein
MQLSNVSYFAHKRELGADFSTPYLFGSTNALRNTTLLQENTKQKEKDRTRRTLQSVYLTPTHLS